MSSVFKSLVKPLIKNPFVRSVATDIAVGAVKDIGSAVIGSGAVKRGYAVTVGAVTDTAKKVGGWVGLVKPTAPPAEVAGATVPTAPPDATPIAVGDVGATAAQKHAAWVKKQAALAARRKQFVTNVYQAPQPWQAKAGPAPLFLYRRPGTQQTAVATQQPSGVFVIVDANGNQGQQVDASDVTPIATEEAEEAREYSVNGANSDEVAETAAAYLSDLPEGEAAAAMVGFASIGSDGFPAEQDISGAGTAVAAIVAVVGALAVAGYLMHKHAGSAPTATLNKVKATLNAMPNLPTATPAPGTPPAPADPGLDTAKKWQSGAGGGLPTATPPATTSGVESECPCKKHAADDVDISGADGGEDFIVEGDDDEPNFAPVGDAGEWVDIGLTYSGQIDNPTTKAGWPNPDQGSTVQINSSGSAFQLDGNHAWPQGTKWPVGPGTYQVVQTGRDGTLMGGSGMQLVPVGKGGTKPTRPQGPASGWISRRRWAWRRGLARIPAYRMAYRTATPIARQADSVLTEVRRSYRSRIDRLRDALIRERGREQGMAIQAKIDALTATEAAAAAAQMNLLGSQSANAAALQQKILSMAQSNPAALPEIFAQLPQVAPVPTQWGSEQTEVVTPCDTTCPNRLVNAQATIATLQSQLEAAMSGGGGGSVDMSSLGSDMGDDGVDDGGLDTEGVQDWSMVVPRDPKVERIVDGCATGTCKVW